MWIVVIVLAWLLVSTWVTLAVVGIDEGYKGDEWAGIMVSCLFSPIMVFIIRPIVLAIKRAKKNKKKIKKLFQNPLTNRQKYAIIYTERGERNRSPKKERNNYD